MGLTAWLFHVIRKGEIGNDTRTGKRTHITKNKRTHKKRTRGGSWSSPLSHRDDESPDTRGREGLIFLEQGRGWAVENGFRRQPRWRLSTSLNGSLNGRMYYRQSDLTTLNGH